MKKMDGVVKAAARERLEMIANGTWMPRGAVIPTGKHKAHRRNNERKELRRLCAEHGV